MDCICIEALSGVFPEKTKYEFIALSAPASVKLPYEEILFCKKNNERISEAPGIYLPSSQSIISA